MAKWNIGEYVRLSKEDIDKLKESDSFSIVNQQAIIESYVKGIKDSKIYSKYVDDGYTGTDFNRPGFQKMIDDIIRGKVNAIVVKDLSRLGRNYIEVGELIENILPKFNVRIIAINDMIDSYERPETLQNIEIHFRNLMNESYAKDISNKLRSSLKTNMNNGKFIGKYAPYGYIKDPDDKHHLIVDKEAAEIVKNIFKSILKGKSKQEIVDELNFKNIYTPSKYFKEILHYNIPKVNEKWTVRTLERILKNRVYTGDLVQGKRTRINHKTHNIVRVSDEDWVEYPNKHSHIVSGECFDSTKDIIFDRNCRVNSNGKLNKYTGYLRCNDCDSLLHKMTYKTRKGVSKTVYYCGTYIKKKRCTKHYITEFELDDMVINSINIMINNLSELNNIINSNYSEEDANYEFQLSMQETKKIEIEKKIDECTKFLKELLEDYKNNFISKEDFENFNMKYQCDLNNYRLEKAKLNSSKINESNFNWIKKFKTTKNIDVITRNIVEEFIDNIYITEDGNIIIKFKFQNQYQDTLCWLKNGKI